MDSSPTKWIVLVAIDFYVDPDQRLEGSVNDVNDLDAWFMQLTPEDSIHITKFLAENTGDPKQKTPPSAAATWPTRENITRTLRDIKKKARAGDIVYFHYSGHGALKSTTAAEYRDYHDSNGSDAALVLFDSENEVDYLRGIDLAQLFDDLVEKQLKLTVVLDCCHAGGISRKELSTYVHIRGIAWDDKKADLSSNTQIANGSPVASQQRYRDGNTK